LKALVTILLIMAVVSSCAFLTADQPYYSGKFERFSSTFELESFLKRRPDTGYLFEYSSSGNVRMFLSSIKAYGPQSVNSYSGTNVQVQGVDEADSVKTDGEYVYVVSTNKVFIVKAYPAEEAETVSSIGVNGTPCEIFVNNDRLILFYSNYTQNQNGRACVISIFDISNRSSPELVREFALEGEYLSSRMINDYVYVVVRKYVGSQSAETDLPRVCFSGDYETIPASQIYYADEPDWNYMFVTILAVNINDSTGTPKTLTVLTGYSSIIYVSTENIYLAAKAWNEDKTMLYLVHFQGDRLSQTAWGQVPGIVLNQFSMDEYGGYFRITTSSRISDPLIGEGRLLQEENNLYVLNPDLAVVGKLEGLAPGEKIYSTRFMGKTCYLVTFRKVDPFFSIDISNPTHPRVLGQLKISGYSSYLHPYDADHIIGVGKETVASEQGDFSWYQGIKISLLDVSDLSEPEEIAKYVVGDRGSDSPVLSDHKAFLFSLEKNLLVLPVSVAKINESEYPIGVPSNAYGQIVWRGVYVFTVSTTLPDKIILKGTITHCDDANLSDDSHQILRALYIDDVLYTISSNEVRLNSLMDLTEIKQVYLEG
jgi:inhibitor of cysteine peptidase